MRFFDAPADLVALTTWTINSLRAYDVAKRFRERGAPVIMGRVIMQARWAALSGRPNGGLTAVQDYRTVTRHE